MATIEMKDVKGKAAGTAELSDAVYGIEPNMHVMHRVVKAQRASWRQKGTGRARQGTIRAPHWVGGGVVFGPHTRSYDEKVNRKEVKLALRSVLSAKLADGELVVVKDLSFDKPRTKDAVAVLKALELEGKRVTMVIGNEDVEEFLSFRNIPEVNILPVGDMNTYELVDNKVLVISEPCLSYIEEVLA